MKNKEQKTKELAKESDEEIIIREARDRIWQEELRARQADLRSSLYGRASWHGGTLKKS